MAERRWRPSTPWDAQPITNGVGARVPEHTLSPPVPIVARVVWAVDGEELVDTEAMGWTGQNAYIRLPDPRYRFTAVWLDAFDVRRTDR